MRPLTPAELLTVWDQGLSQPPLNRAALLLTAACPEQLPEAISRFTIGQRDRALLTLREWLFGPHLSCQAHCEACGERIEFGFRIADIRADAGPTADVHTLEVGDYRVEFRLPTVEDVAAALSDAPDEAAARQVLAARCVLALSLRGRKPRSPHLPEAVLAGIARRMAELDPQADVDLALSCPACYHEWLARFDTLAFIWTEIDAWAMRILREVHTLARAYGWREDDILAMSPWRRQCYLAMVGGT
jgi:hypothetical protein